jgi:hypothetical protein
MNLITFKIINHISKKQNSDIVEVFSVFLANITVRNCDFEKVALKIFDLKKLTDTEIALLNDFFNFLDKDLLLEKKRFKKNLVKFIDDYKKAASLLASFFAIFLPMDAIISKNPENIRKSLSVYPEEIKESIIKALEFLSMLTTDIDEGIKKEIAQNIIEIMIILSSVMKELGVNYET